MVGTRMRDVCPMNVWSYAEDATNDASDLSQPDENTFSAIGKQTELCTYIVAAENVAITPILLADFILFLHSIDKGNIKIARSLTICGKLIQVPNTL